MNEAVKEFINHYHNWWGLYLTTFGILCTFGAILTENPNLAYISYSMLLVGLAWFFFNEGRQ